MLRKKNLGLKNLRVIAAVVSLLTISVLINAISTRAKEVTNLSQIERGSVSKSNGEGAGGSDAFGAPRLTTPMTPNDSAALDRFGSSVAISGDTAVVGSPSDLVGNNASQGSAYVFVRSGRNWIQLQKLTASDGAAGDHFGSSVSISGGFMIVGCHGAGCPARWMC